MTATILAALLVLIFLGTMFLVLVVYYSSRKNRMIKEQQLMQSNFQQELLRTRLEIQEETFRNISQEIHDNIGQSLSFVKLNLNTVDPYNAAAVKEKVNESKNQLTKTIQDLRDLARSLNPDFLSEIGLPAAIEQQLQFLQKTETYRTSFGINGSFYKNDLQKELVVFRIVQELLNNIVKHAEATEIKIQMQYLEEKMTITVTDNGKGFDTTNQSAENNNGLGLRNMLNRMTMINGFITINSSEGNGTTAIIELPKQVNTI